MSGKRPAVKSEDASPAKRQRVGNGATVNGDLGANAPEQKPALPALQAIAKAKQALELQKRLKAKLAAAGISVSHCTASADSCLSQHATPAWLHAASCCSSMYVSQMPSVCYSPARHV